MLNWSTVKDVDTEKKPEGSNHILTTPVKGSTPLELMNKTSKLIQDGALTFLLAEYFYLTIFLIVFSVIIFFVDNMKYWTVITFILGAATSILSGFIGMYVATRSNVRVTYTAAYYFPDKEEAMKNAFNVAFRGGCVMGFCLVSLALAILTLVIIAYMAIFKPHGIESYTVMFEYIAGYGLGGSTVALFCRVGGGIYTKAADVGADLVGKNELGLNEDSPENPATIADNVGDNVGDIAGMGSDLFGSFAEATCAALVVSGTSPQLIQNGNFMVPLVISAAGIIVCIFTTFFATHLMEVRTEDRIESTLKWQIIISSVLLTPTIYAICYFWIPHSFSFLVNEKDKIPILTSTNTGVMICCLCGLWSGMIIGWFTDYYTSKAHSPTQNLAKACKSGAAINIIHGLALGYNSCIIPIICISATIFVSFTLCGMYGIAIAALGMLSNLAVSLAIDAYGPISDNAGGISEMSELPKDIRDITDALDAAGNTTAAIGKGFAIGSACLVALALFGAFVTRTKLVEVNILEEIQIACLIIGAMIPYAFSALTMKSVGEAAAEMCKQVAEQVRNNNNDPKECIRISTNSSLREMILPGMIVIFTPLLVGTLFGPKAVTGYLAGVIVSGVQMAISSSNSGGAWDNAKKYIEGQHLLVEATDHNENDRYIQPGALYYPKKSKPHKAAVVGDTVGDPLKDTSGPSINILIKLSAIVSLVFGSFFVENSVFKL